MSVSTLSLAAGHALSYQLNLPSSCLLLAMLFKSSRLLLAMLIMSSCLLLAVLFISFPCTERFVIYSGLRALPLSTCCVWMRYCSLESMPALSCGVHWCRHLAGTAHVVRDSVSNGFQVDVSHVVVAVVHRGLAQPSRFFGRSFPPGCDVSHVCDSCDSCSRRFVSCGLTDRPVSGISGAFSACSWQILASLPQAPD